MIINIRGTNGSGKSTLVKALMDRYAVRVPVYDRSRRQPVGYNCANHHGTRLYVIGHYETACGGGDTMDSVDSVFADIETWAPTHNVAFEGIITQDDVKRTVALKERHQLLVIALDVPIEECLRAVQARRDARGDARPFDPTNTIDRERTLRRTIQRLKDAGVDANWMPRHAALDLCIQLLDLPYAAIHRAETITTSGQLLLDL